MEPKYVKPKKSRTVTEYKYHKQSTKPTRFKKQDSDEELLRPINVESWKYEKQKIYKSSSSSSSSDHEKLGAKEKKYKKDQYARELQDEIDKELALIQARKRKKKYSTSPKKSKTRQRSQEYEELMRPVSRYTRKRAHVVPSDSDSSSSDDEGIPNYEDYISLSSGIEFKSKKYPSDISPPSSYYGPRFQLQMRSHVVPSGMNTKFTACLRGKPKPTIKCFKNGKELHESISKYRMHNIEGVVSLEIRSCHEGDSGTYRCQAKNQHGEASDYSTLEVTESEFESTSSKHVGDLSQYGKSWSRATTPRGVPPVSKRTTTPSGKGAPYFFIFPKDIFISSGETAKFTCECDGKPFPKVLWYHDEKPLVHGRKYNLGSSRGRRILEIVNTDVTDNGSYQCVAESINGIATAEFMLEVAPTLNTRKNRICQSSDAKGPLIISPLNIHFRLDGQIRLECSVANEIEILNVMRKLDDIPVRESTSIRSEKKALNDIL